MDKERSFIKYFPTDTKFKLTDGVEVTVTEKFFFFSIHYQKMIMNKACNDIPLLLNRIFMKGTKLFLNLIKWYSSVNTVDLICTLLGHYEVMFLRGRFKFANFCGFTYILVLFSNLSCSPFNHHVQSA